MSESKTKGFAQRLIYEPGYHIHPQFDMVHTRHLIVERRNKKKQFSLMLAPMVDMFSILVIYLLMNFSSSGEIFFVAKAVQIPKASKGTPMRSLPLISIVGNTVMFDSEEPGRLGQTVTEQELNDGEMPKLRRMLRQFQALETQIHPDKPFKGEINLQAGETTPVDDVKKIMKILIAEGWTGINFIVDPSTK